LIADISQKCYPGYKLCSFDFNNMYMNNYAHAQRTVTTKSFIGQCMAFWGTCVISKVINALNATFTFKK
jgi:hypothetical protein